MGTITKADLIQMLSNDTQLNKKESRELLELMFESMSQALANGENVKISGFGNFCLRDKPERPGRNPRTGEAATISARRVVNFKASDKLKETIGKVEED